MQSEKHRKRQIEQQFQGNASTPSFCLNKTFLIENTINKTTRKSEKKEYKETNNTKHVHIIHKIKYRCNL